MRCRQVSTNADILQRLDSDDVEDQECPECAQRDLQEPHTHRSRGFHPQSPK